MILKTCGHVSKKNLRTGYLSLYLKQKKITTFKKDAWKRPLNSSQLQKISLKNRLCTRYIETRDASIYKKYKTMRNSVRNATRKLEKEEQKKVATHCRKNPKIFWKYINSKR